MKIKSRMELEALKIRLTQARDLAGEAIQLDGDEEKNTSNDIYGRINDILETIEEVE